MGGDSNTIPKGRDGDRMMSLPPARPTAFRVKTVRMQSEAGKPVDGRAGWFDLAETKRAEIELESDPKIRGKGARPHEPLIRIEMGSRTGHIDCSGTLIPAICVYASVVKALALRIGGDPTQLFQATSAPTNEGMDFVSSDPDQLVRLLRTQRERGEFDAVG